MKAHMVTISLILLLSLSLTSCSTKPSADELKKRFEIHTPDRNVVAVLDSSSFYYADHTLRLRDIANGEELNNGYLIVDGKLYFSTTKENGTFDFSLYVYTCDSYGGDKHLVFERHGYKTRPWVTGNQEHLYIEHYATHAVDASARTIDSYNVVTGVYQTESTGETVCLSDYEKDPKGVYSCIYEDGILSIVDSQKDTTYSVNPTALVSDTFNEELNGLDCSFCGFYSADNEKMFMLYRIDSNGPQYPHLVCEYILESNEAVFKLLFFADDITTFHIEYL